MGAAFLSHLKLDREIMYKFQTMASEKDMASRMDEKTTAQ
jgi:hypothetical protein